MKTKMRCMKNKKILALKITCNICFVSSFADTFYVALITRSTPFFIRFCTAFFSIYRATYFHFGSLFTSCKTAITKAFMCLVLHMARCTNVIRLTILPLHSELIRRGKTIENVCDETIKILFYEQAGKRGKKKDGCSQDE